MVQDAFKYEWYASSWQILVDAIFKIMGAFSIGLIKWNVTSDYKFLSPKKIPQILALLI